jgi:hypothetical protein
VELTSFDAGVASRKSVVARREMKRALPYPPWLHGTELAPWILLAFKSSILPGSQPSQAGELGS